MLEANFQRLGLNENEREVYLAVLGAGKITHERASRATGVNRTTIYSIAEKLKRLGLITEDLGGKVSYLASEGPDAILRVVEREEQQIKEKKRTAEELSRELAALATGQNYSVPKIKFVQEKDLSDYLYKKTKDWLTSGERFDNTWWGYQDNSFTEHYEDWIEYCWKHYPDVKVRFFSNAAVIEEELRKRHIERQVRPLPPGNEFDSCLWVSGDYIIMVRSREKPHYLVEIYDTILARNQRQLFKSLWSQTGESK